MTDFSYARGAAVLTIDLGAVQANWRSLRDRLHGAACGAVLKADAYGLGAARIAQALAAAGCRHFVTAHLDEAIALRPHVPAAAEVFVLHGPPPGLAAEFLAHDLTPVLNSLSQIEAWTTLAREEARRLPAVLQVDTGMSRLGLSPAELVRLAEEPSRLEGVAVRAVMSHLACAERPDHPMNAAQLARFATLRRQLPAAPASLAASSGIFLGPDYHFDIVRPGSALYGIAPVAGQPNPLRQAVRLDAPIQQTRRIAAGESVGYGATWHAPAPARIATVPAGYADGYLRSLGNRAHGYVGGIAVPLVGMVSMDMATFDVSAVPEAALGPDASIELIGPHQTLDALAQRAGTIGYEILTSLGSRYQRRYLDAPAAAPTTSSKQDVFA
ncbi:Alanine racemase [Rhodovastum atsumiense]|uniref:Alanine racemase n=1 Tax=Rhodovastum atsumiense TaxID=504468 RepID=A0A5M6IX52_9PROT|nr:alanine racemase [Rhodovastum atsumiense]KAA5612872.1 alanine racemase [Rhodovastum atsumiense]CAH2601054.1 Alanine racemase [Rhodovastum atsumiense]